MFLLLMLVGVIPLYIVSTIMVYSSSQNQIQTRMAELQYQSVALISELEERDYMSNMSQPVVTAEIEQLVRFFRGRIILVDSNYRICKDTYYMGEGKYNISEEVITCFAGTNTSRYDAEAARYGKAFAAAGCGYTDPVYDGSRRLYSQGERIPSGD